MLIGLQYWRTICLFNYSPNSKKHVFSVYTLALASKSWIFVEFLYLQWTFKLDEKVMKVDVVVVISHVLKLWPNQNWGNKIIKEGKSNLWGLATTVNDIVYVF